MSIAAYQRVLLPASISRDSEVQYSCGVDRSGVSPIKACLGDCASLPLAADTASHFLYTCAAHRDGGLPEEMGAAVSAAKEAQYSVVVPGSEATGRLKMMCSHLNPLRRGLQWPRSSRYTL